MAALALGPLRTLLPSLGLGFAREPILPRIFPFLIPAQLALPISLSWPSIQSLLELFPPFLLAVPKKKVSHSRKSMRSANKGLKDKTNIVACSACGNPKLSHHLCPNCYSIVNRAFKARGSGSSMPAM